MYQTSVLRYLYSLVFIYAVMQSSCVSKRKFTEAIKKVDSTNTLLQSQIEQTRKLRMEYNHLKIAYLQHLKEDSIGINNSSETTLGKNELLTFPNPPPQPSTHYVFNAKTFQGMKTFNDVNLWLVNILKRSGYSNKITYFLFDDGFAVATTIEQINSNGTLKSENERWSSSRISPMKSGFSFKEYFRVLFTAQPGYYRSFVFVVSSSLYRLSQDSYSKELLSRYLSQGAIGLPRSLNSSSLPNGFQVTALIYEFKKLENSPDAVLVLDGLDGFEHLKKSALINGN